MEESTLNLASPVVEHFFSAPLEVLFELSGLRLSRLVLLRERPGDSNGMESLSWMVLAFATRSCSELMEWVWPSLELV